MPPQTTNNLTESCDQTIQNHCDSMANTFLVNCLLDGFKKPKLSVLTQENSVEGKLQEAFRRIDMLETQINDLKIENEEHIRIHRQKKKCVIL